MARDRGFEPVLPIFHRDKLDSGADEILIGRNQVEAFDLGVDGDALDRLVEN